MPSKVEDYIAGLPGWQPQLAAFLRARVLAAGLREDFKWGQPVFASDKGPVCFLKSGKSNLLFGFWRGQQLTMLDPRLEPFGSFRMAGIKLTGAGQIDAAQVGLLVEAGIALNQQYGDPLKEPKLR